MLSNPPYIPPANVPADPEAALHDPDMALYGGGEDGMQIPSAIAARAFELLTPGGLFIMDTTTSRKKPSPSSCHALASRTATRCVT